MQMAVKFCSAFALLSSILHLGGCGDEEIALPWADAKVESLATLGKGKRSAGKCVEKQQATRTASGLGASASAGAILAGAYLAEPIA
jgi:hypothetical protein